jgi:hypothetical protein
VLAPDCKSEQHTKTIDANDMAGLFYRVDKPLTIHVKKLTGKWLLSALFDVVDRRTPAKRECILCI